MVGSAEYQDIKKFRSELRHDLYDLDELPKQIWAFYERGNWRHYEDPTGNEYTYEDKDFPRFVEAKPEEGLGFPYDKIIDLSRHNATIQTNLIELRNDGVEMGPPKKISHDNIMTNADQGTAKGYSLRKLKKSAPEVFDRVKGGEISANAGMVQAGFRKKTCTVELSVEGFVRYINNHFDDEDRKSISDAILGGICQKAGC